MSFDRLLAHETTIAELRRMIAEQRVPHALLLAGPGGVGKTTAALALARALVCTGTAARPCDACRACRLSAKLAHPDVLVVVPTEREDGETPDDVGRTLDRIRKALDDRLKTEAKGGAHEPRAGAKPVSIGIAAIRFHVQAELAKKPVEAEKRVVVLSDADAMTLPAQNALLKTLEEPPSFAHVVLTSARPDALLDTVRSRCRTVRFAEIPRDVLARAAAERAGADPPTARLAAGLAGGSLPRALRLASQPIAAARKDAMALVAAARTPDAQAAAEVARTVVVSGERDRDRLAQLAQLALLYYEDILLARAGVPDDALAHADLAREIHADAAAMDGEAIGRRIRALEDMQDGLARNLLPKLLVANTILTMAGA